MKHERWMEVDERTGRPPTMNVRIYCASRVHHAPMWRKARDEGAHIVSSWIDEAGEGETGDFGDLWARIGREVSISDRLVLYIEDGDFPLKGALVEVGMALQAGKPVHVVLDPDIKLEGRTLRPVGSWLMDRRVKQFATLADALKP